VKLLNVALVALSLYAGVAQAQDSAAPAADAGARQSAQVDASRPADRPVQRSAAPAGKSSDEACVGPVSFCNIYFGS
jgi:hypothetical protein